jgi:hypothetical protein
MLLTQITPGIWIVPERVVAVIARTGGQIGGVVSPPTVHIVGEHAEVMAWECKTYEQAMDYAAKLVSALTAAPKDGTKLMELP